MRIREEEEVSDESDDESEEQEEEEKEEETSSGSGDEDDAEDRKDTQNKSSAGAAPAPKGDEAAVRKMKNLSSLTSQFISLLKACDGGPVEIWEAARVLQVGRRRVYEVLNVLEGCELVGRDGKGKVRWVAPFSIDRIPAMTMDLTERTMLPKTERDLLRQKHQLQNLNLACRWLETTITNEQKVVMNLAKKSWISVTETRLRDEFEGKHIFVINTKSGNVTAQVHPPVHDRAAGKSVHQMSFESQQPIGLSVILPDRIERIKVERPTKRARPLPEVTASQLFLPVKASLPPFSENQLSQSTTGTLHLTLSQATLSPMGLSQLSQLSQGQ